MNLIANTPQAPYYAVIFSSHKSKDLEGYSQMAATLETLAVEQPGYLGIEIAQDELGITVSYWSDLESIQRWKENITHLQGQEKGRQQWYSSYRVRVAKVERDYGFDEAFEKRK